jgi:hypothetical protein
MSHRATKRFWACYAELPNPVRQTADKCFAILKDDPSHSSLHFKKVGKVWSVRIGAAHSENCKLTTLPSHPVVL